MKFATWNLERGKTRPVRAAQMETLASVGADIVVLTEPGTEYRGGPGAVTSPAERPRARGPEPWVAIVGPGVEPVALALPYGRLAAAARVSVRRRAFIVYGAVLPWQSVRSHAPEVVLSGEDSFAVFRRVLSEQAADIAALRTEHGLPIIWAGDFNQTLSGPLYGCSAARRVALADVLDGLGLVAWNRAADHARPNMCAVDLICGPRELDPTAVGRIDPERDGRELSDHAGYWVEI